MDLAIGIITIILGIAAASLPSFYEVTKKERAKKKLTKIGWTVVILIVLLISLQIFQIYSAEIGKQAVINDQNRRDSLSRDFIVKNNKSIVTPFADGLRKYGLKYDTARREIEKLVKDSSKKIIIINSAKPVFSACLIEVEHKQDTLNNKITLCTSQAALYNLESSIYLVARADNNQLRYLETPFHIKLEKLTLENPLIKSIKFWGSDIKTYKTLYYLIKSNYSDQNGKKGEKYNSFDLISCDIKSNTMGFLTEKEAIWIKDFYEKNGISVK